MRLKTPSIINSIQKDRPPSIHWQVSFSLELILCNAIDHRHDIYVVFLTQVIFSHPEIKFRGLWPVDWRFIFSLCHLIMRSESESVRFYAYGTVLIWVIYIPMLNKRSAFWTIHSQKFEVCIQGNDKKSVNCYYFIIIIKWNSALIGD